ncbi:MAG: PIN domain-containing protein [Synergistaceae bacterium]|nr:PIN domain-containing protein [Synergistaceae bacterium]
MEIRKIRLYLETTVFNYYFDDDRDGHEDVLKLFEAIKAGEFEAYTSDYVLDELKKAKEPKRSKMLALVDDYEVTLLSDFDKVSELARLYIARGTIPASHLYDSSHVAMASVNKLDCIVSYNFHHINRDKTRYMTAVINEEEGYGEIMIATAKEVLDDAETV